MKLGNLLLASLAALILLVDGPAARADDEVTYTLVVKKVEVHKTKANGEAWDINDGKPDLCVIVRNLSDKDSKSFETKTANDTYSHEFNAPTSIKVRADQNVEFDVVDKDALVNDRIGRVEKRMTAEILKEGKLKLENFDRVISLEIEIKKLERSSK